MERRHFAAAWRSKTRPLFGADLFRTLIRRAAGMFAVEIYAAIRREEPARGGADFRIEPGYGRQDVPLFGAGRHSRQIRYTWLRTN
jgi:hypothetical protein